jgi:OOP family OmpA-OmpF porin
MEFISKTQKIGWALLLSTGLGACASPSVQRVEYPQGTDAQAKVTEIKKRLNEFSEKNWHLMSPNHFQEAQESSMGAQKSLDEGKPSQEILEQAGEAEGHLRFVEEHGKKYEQRLMKVTSARRAAMDARAANLMPGEWAEADAQFRDIGEDIEHGSFSTDATRLSRLEARYSDLETKALKRSVLGEVNRIIESAEDRDAGDRAPQTLAQAKVKYDSALRAIEGNRRNPQGYEAAVQDAWAWARKLDGVMNTVEQSGATEMAAVQIYDQQEQIASTQSSLARAQEKTSTFEQMQAENQKYATQEQMNQRIRELSQEFSPEEAQVFQDGNRIVLRLKQVQFPTARSELPRSSLGTLQKVKEMIAAVPAERIIVEGHTDSTGNRKVNDQISQKRAETVKQFLVADNTFPSNKIEAKGLGERRPLTSNDSKMGRATNRRVDVVIETDQSVRL